MGIEGLDQHSHITHRFIAHTSEKCQMRANSTNPFCTKIKYLIKYMVRPKDQRNRRRCGTQHLCYYIVL